MAQKTSPKVVKKQETNTVVPEKQETMKVSVRFLEDYKNGNIVNRYFRAGDIVDLEYYKVPQIVADKQGVIEILKKEA